MSRDRACTCGNPEFGFNCMCDWMALNPGSIKFHCEFCGFYTASDPRCNKCQKDEDSMEPEEFEVNCSCHISAPCSNCLDPRNPSNDPIPCAALTASLKKK